MKNDNCMSIYRHLQYYIILHITVVYLWFKGDSSFFTFTSEYSNSGMVCIFVIQGPPLSSLWFSGTVIYSRILILQTVHLQIQLVYTVVSGDGKSPLNSSWVIHCTTVMANDCHPFQAFPRSLSDPSHPVVIKMQARGSAGQFVRLTRFYHSWLRFSQSLTLQPWKIIIIIIILYI